MNVLMTGGTGYLGSHIVHRLVRDSQRVLCLTVRGDPCTRLSDVISKLQFCDADNPSVDDAIRAFSPDAVIHTATVYERGEASLNDVYQANLAFPFRTLQSAIKAGARQWINTGSALPAGLNAYSLSKTQFSQWGCLAAMRGEIGFTNLVLEQFYGKNAPDTHFIARVVDKLRKNEPLNLTVGTQHREFIHIDDAVEAYIGVLGRCDAGYTEIPIGTGEAPSIKTVVLYLKEISGSSSELRFGAVPLRAGEPESHFDPAAMEAFGLKCRYSWREGMKKLFE